MLKRKKYAYSHTQLINMLLGLLLCTPLLNGCKSHKIPSTATISDSGFSESTPKAQLFVVEMINGNAVYNSSTEGKYVTRGDELVLQTRLLERTVPTKPLKVQISGRCITGSPIHAIRNQEVGSFLEIRGIVEFTPRADGRYVVKGNLNRDLSFLWIEDLDTHQPVTEKIIMSGRRIGRS